MHIKQIIIEGFKTYKSRTEFSDFSPHVNAVIGQNGSGKSNIYDAIHFVMTEKYANLRPDDKQKQQHEGAGVQSACASVEILIDNSDGSLAVEKQSLVSLKRMLTEKKDEYFLQGKSISRQELSSLLESGGFSSRNPYFFVQQGRVMELVKMNDAARYDQVQDVAGTKIYEERKQESLRIMTNTDVQKKEALTLLDQLHGRVVTLKAEEKVLTEYEKLNGKRKNLELTRCTLELEDVEKKLVLLGGSQQSHVDVWRRRAAQNTQRNNLELHITRCKTQLEGKQRVVETEKREYSKFQALVEDQQQQVEAQEALQQQEVRSVQKCQLGIEEQDAKITTMQMERTVLDSASVALETSVRSDKEILRQKEQELEQLGLKVGQIDNVIFGSEKARIEYIERKVFQQKQEVASLTRLKEVGKEQSVRLQKEVKSSEKVILKLADEIQNCTVRVDETGAKVGMLTTQLAIAEKKKAEIDSKLYTLVNQIPQEKVRMDELLAEQDALTYGEARGVEAIRTQRLPGVHGPLGAVLNVLRENWQLPIEVAMKSKLHNIVCDNDETASKVLKLVIQMKLPRVTLLPANRLLVTNLVQFKPTEQAVALRDNVSVDPRLSWTGVDSKDDLTKAVKNSLSNSVVCKSIELCSTYANDKNITCYTSGGDSVDKYGVFRGGFRDKRMTMDRWRDYGKVVAKLNDMEAQVSKLQVELTNASNTVASLSAERTQVVATNSTSRMALNNVENELTDEKNKLQTLQKELHAMQTQASDCDTQVQSVQALVTALELAQKEKVNGTTADFDRVAALKTEIATQKAKIQKTEEEVGKKKEHSARLAQELIEVYIPKKNKLKHSLHNMVAANSSLSLAMSVSHSMLTSTLMGDGNNQGNTAVDDPLLLELRNALSTITVQAEQCETSVARSEKQVATLHKQLESSEKDMADQAQNEADLAVQIQSVERSSVGAQSEKAVLERKLASLEEEKKILEAAKCQVVMRIDMDTANVQISAISSKIEALGRVNLHARTILTSVEEKASELDSRLAQLEEGRLAIYQLIQHLDVRKQEALDRTLASMSHHFATVFRELVPRGTGRLITMTSDSNNTSNNDVIGIGLEVSFTDHIADNARLSGGQKTIVALALLFSLQRVEPSPQYLLDEVDANLDATFRTAVAKLIKSLARNAQVICTSFREEFLQSCNKFYKVEFINRESRVSEVSQAAAKKLILETVKE